MPWVSEAQRRLFYARPELRKYIPEYEAATGKRKLPYHVRHKRRHKDAINHSLRKRHVHYHHAGRA